MKREQVIQRLRDHEAQLRAQGVAHAALFGSTARGEQQTHSDVDILVEITPDANIGVFEYVGIVHFIEDMFPVRVDVANRGQLKSHVRLRAERDAIYAF